MALGNVRLGVSCLDKTKIYLFRHGKKDKGAALEKRDVTGELLAVLTQTIEAGADGTDYSFEASDGHKYLVSVTRKER